MLIQYIVCLQFPNVHDSVVQSTTNTVHIPIANTGSQKVLTWYCITRLTADEDDEDLMNNSRRTEFLKKAIFSAAQDSNEV